MRLFLVWGLLVISTPALRAQPVGDAAIGAQLRPDLAFANRSPVQIFHVAVSGNDANPGTADRPWRTIKRAIRTLQAGQAAHVHTGTYAEYDMITAFDGRADAPIWLMAAPGERVVIQGSSSLDRPFFLLQKAYWIIDGFEIAANGQTGHAIRFDRNHHAIVRNVNAHHGAGRAAIAVYAARDVAVINCTISEYWRVVNGRPEDSHGVVVVSDSERVLVKGNRSWKNSGDSIQCMGPEDGGGGINPPKDITIEENRYFEDRENAVDLKTCRNVTVRNNKCYGYRAADTAPGGAALVVHSNAGGILFEGNRIWNSGMAASMGAANGELGAIVFRRNVIFDITTELNGAGAGIRAARVQRAITVQTATGQIVTVQPTIKIYHNTFHNIPGYAIRLGDEGLARNAVVINNIVMNAGRALEITTANTTPLQCDRNVYWNAPLRINNQTTTLAQWQNWQGTGMGYDRTSVIADPMFVDDPRNNDYYTKPGSPARDRAIPLGYPYCFAGPDIGFLESCF